MKKEILKSQTIIILVIYCLSYSNLKGQGVHNLIDLDNNDVENRLEKLEIDNKILNHYSLKDINSIRLADNEKYKQISYY